MRPAPTIDEIKRSERFAGRLLGLAWLAVIALILRILPFMELGDKGLRLEGSPWRFMPSLLFISLCIMSVLGRRWAYWALAAIMALGGSWVLLCVIATPGSFNSSLVAIEAILFFPAVYFFILYRKRKTWRGTKPSCGNSD